MSIIPMLLKEMEQEAQTTRKMLSRVPADKFNWQPHPKSMSTERLAVHIAELPEWVSLAIHTDGLNFADNPYTPKAVEGTQGLINLLDESLTSGKAALESADEAELEKPWVLSNGDQVLSKTSKAEMIRMAYSQIVHHRAQLGVYLRLLDIPIPGSYGPSADEPSF